MMATGKHFPGHGDTEENSHLTVTTIHASRARIDTVELVPFRRAIAAGVQGIMTFHGLVPALDTASVPATLNPAIMTGLLRRQLGFNGLLITDAMDMNGVLSRVTVGQATRGQSVAGNYGTINNSIGIAEACKLAIGAGADILLMPSDVPAAIDAVVAGVREGRFTQARVDSSVRRVLEIKRRFNLDRRRLVSLDSLRSIVGDTANLTMAATAAQRSITLAKDSLNLVPFVQQGAAAPKMLSITIATRADLPAGATFNAELRRGIPALRTELINPDDPAPNYARLLAIADSVDVAIVCIVSLDRYQRGKPERARTTRAVHARARTAARAYRPCGVRQSLPSPASAVRFELFGCVGRIPGLAGRGRTSAVGTRPDQRTPPDHDSTVGFLWDWTQPIDRAAGDAVAIAT